MLLLSTLATTGLASGPAALADVASYENVVKADQPLVFYPFDDSPDATTFFNVMHPGDNAMSVGGGHTEVGWDFDDEPDSASLIYNGGTEPAYAQAPNLGPLDGDNSRTVEFWFESRNPAPQCLISAGQQSHGAAFSVCLTDGNQYATPRSGQPGVYVQFYDADIYVPYDGLTTGAWTYLAVTLNGSDVTVVIDGEAFDGYVWNGSTYSAALAQPFALPLTPDTAVGPMQIGGPGGWSPALHGAIDELAVYPTALPASDLFEHFSAGITRPQIVVTAYPVQTIVGRRLSATDVAAFTYVPQPGGTVPPASSFTATIDWGDNTTSSGIVGPIGSGLNPTGRLFAVAGSHTYASPVTGTVSVEVSTPVASASGTAAALVYPLTPSAQFIVNPSSPQQFGIGLLMPETPHLGQRPIKSYVWQFADTDALVVDEPKSDKQIDATVSQLIADPGSSPLRVKGILLGILPKDANDFIGGWSNDQVVQLAKIWRLYFPQHIVPHAFDYFGTDGIRLTITDAGGGVSSYVQNPQVGIACLPWGGPLHDWFDNYTTCDTFNGFAAQFGPRRPADYVSFSINADLPSLPDPFGGGFTLSVVGPVHSGDPVKLSVGAQFSVGVGAGAPTTTQLGWLGPPGLDDQPVTQDDVDNFVNGLSLSGGAAVQVGDFGLGFTAVASPTTYPDGEPLAGQLMVGEESVLAIGPIQDHLLAASAAASIGCSVPIDASSVQRDAQALYDDATSGAKGATDQAATELQHLIGTLTNSGIDFGAMIASAITGCIGTAG